MKLRIVNDEGNEVVISVRSYQEIRPLELIPDVIKIAPVNPRKNTDGHVVEIDISKPAFLGMIAVIAGVSELRAIKTVRELVPGLEIIDAKEVVKELLHLKSLQL